MIQNFFCLTKAKANIILKYSASSLIRSSLIRFLANPAGFSREVDLFTLAFNFILLRKSIQFTFYKYASNILLRHNKVSFV